MNKIIKLGALGTGGLVLFAGAFFGFAQVLGIPPHELPIVGSRFPVPEEAELGEEGVDEGAEADAETPPAETSEEPMNEAPVIDSATQRLAVIDSFTLSAPYSSAELKTLVDELKAKRAELTEWEQALDAREAALAARAEQLTDQEEQIKELQSQLDAQKGGDGGGGGGGAAPDPVNQIDPWKKRSQLFAEGSADDLAKRLQTYTPEEGARILQGLEPERALELLNALPSETEWKAYAEAYAELPSGGQ